MDFSLTDDQRRARYFVDEAAWENIDDDLPGSAVEAPEFLSSRAAAEYLGVSVRWLHRRVWGGRIRVDHSEGTSYVFARAELDRYLAARA